MSNEISNSQDVIDSRDVIARIEELQSEINDAYDEYCEAKKEIEEPPFSKDEWLAIEKTNASPIWDSAVELKALLVLQSDAKGYAPDWQYGSALIRRTYFVEYCCELVADIGDVSKDLPAYLADNIDWDGVAHDLEVDYTTVDFDGVEYLIR